MNVASLLLLLVSLSGVASFSSPPLRGAFHVEGPPLRFDRDGKVILKGMTVQDITSLMCDLGEANPLIRAKTLAKWMYHIDRLAETIEDTKGHSQDRYCFGKPFRERLSSVATIDGGLKLSDVRKAPDGTYKLVSTLTDEPANAANVESVIIPMLSGPKKQERYTLCVSSQVGCAMNCQFCFTGRMGLLRSLEASQIVEQVVVAKRYLRSIGDKRDISGVVFMGMGEPGDNAIEVMKALEIMTDPTEGLRLKSSRITVSTVGVIPFIISFCEARDAGAHKAMLAVSLHAANERVRSNIMPLNNRYPLAELIPVLEKYYPATGRHIMNVEVTLLKGINDSEADATALVKLLQGVRCVVCISCLQSPNSSAQVKIKWPSFLPCTQVNLITFNPHEGTVFETATRQATQLFRATVMQGGKLCTLRESKGPEDMSACGQLGDLGGRQAIRVRAAQ
ncbi:unnamed protein product [Chrysoparadoxa australica]